MLTIRLVLIDDQKFYLLFMENLLQEVHTEYALEVHTFTSPLEALEFLEKNEVDIVISDYRMPELKADELIKALKKKNRFEDLLFVVVTAFDERDVMSRCLELGATDFIRKPLDKFEFLPKLRNLIYLAASIRFQKNQVALLSHEIEKAVAAIKRREREIVNRLTMAAEHRDIDTGNHILRVGEYSKLIAKAAGFDKEFLELIAWAAPLHDVGKVAIPDSILLKPGKLTAEEWEIMKTHTIHGYKILAGSGIKLLDMAAEIALYHHEKWNGKGYPEGLKGEEIPISARIVAIADVFDAVTMKRPYKDPWPLEKAFALIEKEAGEHFDPELARIFLEHEKEVREIHQKLQEK